MFLLAERPQRLHPHIASRAKSVCGRGCGLLTRRFNYRNLIILARNRVALSHVHAQFAERLSRVVSAVARFLTVLLSLYGVIQQHDVSGHIFMF